MRLYEKIVRRNQRCACHGVCLGTKRGPSVYEIGKVLSNGEVAGVGLFHASAKVCSVALFNVMDRWFLRVVYSGTDTLCGL